MATAAITQLLAADKAISSAISTVAQGVKDAAARVTALVSQLGSSDDPSISQVTEDLQTEVQNLQNIALALSAIAPAQAQPTATNTNLSVDSTTAAIGGSVTLTASVFSTGDQRPTGSVLFSRDGGQFANEPVDATGTVVFTDSGLTAGTHSYTADYQGDTLNSPSNSAPVVVTVS